MKSFFGITLTVLAILTLTACQQAPVEDTSTQTQAENEPAAKEQGRDDGRDDGRDGGRDGGRDDGSAGEEECSTASEEPTIAGSYVDNYGHTQIIGEGKWTIQLDESKKNIPEVAGLTTSTYKICSVDNDQGVLIAENAANRYHPNKFSQFNWLMKDDQIWFCQVVVGAETLQEASAHPPADPSNPAAGGCGGFPWSRLQQS